MNWDKAGKLVVDMYWQLEAVERDLDALKAKFAELEDALGELEDWWTAEDRDDEWKDRFEDGSRNRGLHGPPVTKDVVGNDAPF